MAEAFEVHGQKGDVGHDVAPTQFVVEVEAVDDPRAVIEYEDVIREEVAVSVDDLSVFDPRLEQRFAPIEVFDCERLDPGHAIGLHDSRGHGGQLCEAVTPAAGHDLASPDRFEVGVSRRAFVERSDVASDAVERVGHVLASIQTGAEAVIRWQAAHHQDRVADLAVVAVDASDPEIHVRREALVQFEFPATRGVAGLHRGEVEKSEIEGLFDLVGAVAEQDHDRRMSFGNLGSERCGGATERRRPHGFIIAVVSGRRGAPWGVEVLGSRRNRELLGCGPLAKLACGRLDGGAHRCRNVLGIRAHGLVGVGVADRVGDLLGDGPETFQADLGGDLLVGEFFLGV